MRLAMGFAIPQRENRLIVFSADNSYQWHGLLMHWREFLEDDFHYDLSVGGIGWRAWKRGPFLVFRSHQQQGGRNVSVGNAAREHHRFIRDRLFFHTDRTRRPLA